MLPDTAWHVICTSEEGIDCKGPASEVGSCTPAGCWGRLAALQVCAEGLQSGLPAAVAVVGLTQFFVRTCSYAASAVSLMSCCLQAHGHQV